MPEQKTPQTQQPMVSYRAMFDAEVAQAVDELQRPAAALFTSGVIAGVSVGFALLTAAFVVAQHGGMPDTLWTRLMLGSAYALGFLLAILARSDLFTEYTTITILPVLVGDSRLRALVRLWALVYAGNLVGGAIVSVAATSLGTEMGIFSDADVESLALHLIKHEWWVILGSAVVAGWLMGMLSWLLAGGRDTTSQIVFIWLVGTTIGVLGLHHAITGGIELFAAALSGSAVGWSEVLSVLFLTTLGNTLGGLAFAALIRQGVEMNASGDGDTAERETGRDRRRARRE
ncbi:MAG TPA: formate/nitrite transporter family protein [Devosia sp.]|nr:formate/nitrite transporter family protein [Devosia sp.]